MCAWQFTVVYVVCVRGAACQLRFVRENFGADVPILFTPNFCRIREYATAFELGADVTVDGPAVLLQSPEVGSLCRCRRVCVCVALCVVCVSVFPPSPWRCTHPLR